MSNDITLPAAKFDHALDEYYGFLHKIAGNLGPNKKLVVMNTITPYSIVKEHPLYNMFVLRAYADLVIRRNTIKDAGSPKTPPNDIIDSANSGDAWSSEYYLLAYPNLLNELKKYIKDPAVVSEIAALETVLGGRWKAYLMELNSLEDLWTKYATDNKLDEAANPVKYFREKNAWWRKRIGMVQKLYDDYRETLLLITDLEDKHLDSAGLRYKELKDNLSKINQAKLPIRPELEDVTVPDPTSGTADYDVRPAIYPAGTAVFDHLLDESEDGSEEVQFQRGYRIERQKTTTYTHDTDWAASGSASKFFFLKANLSVAEKTHFEEQIKSVGLIEVGFRAIQDVVIIRGKWYSGGFLQSKIFQKWLDAQPEFRQKLRSLITSVIVCRGLTVKLHFGVDIDQKSWRDLRVSGSGGLSVGGYNFGLSGHYNSHTEWTLKDVTNNSVTFADGPDVCRVIGLRVEDVLGDSAKGTSVSGFDFEQVPDDLIDAYRSGEISYNELMDRVHNG